MSLLPRLYPSVRDDWDGRLDKGRRSVPQVPPGKIGGDGEKPGISAVFGQVSRCPTGRGWDSGTVWADTECGARREAG